MRIRMALLCTLVTVALVESGCAPNKPHNLPPAQQLMHPGPGVAGPGPGVMIPGGGGYAGAAGADSQFAFVGPDGMAVHWDVGAEGLFDSEPLIVPGRQNFGQGAIYRLKLTNIPGRPGVELYPSLEVGPTTPRTDAYLAHNAIPVQFTEEDLDQVISGNYVTKVIYLPDPEFQELALAGVETLVSTRLDPGVDPIVEADRRGAILAIVRVGNKDLQVPGAEGEFPADGVVPAAHMNGYAAASAMGGGHVGAAVPAPLGAPTSSFQPTAMPPNYVSGVNGPQWGMPMSGTPIGLPGPPHIPLGVPAGLQMHQIKNRTPVHMPGPTKAFTMRVKQHPGFSYPKPVNNVRVHENLNGPRANVSSPHWNKQRNVIPNDPYCEDCP